MEDQPERPDGHEQSMSLGSAAETAAAAAEEAPLIRWGWLRALLYLIAAVAGSFAAGFVTGLVIIAVTGQVDLDLGTAMDTWEGLVLQSAQLFGLLIVTVLFRLLIDRKSMVSLGFGFNGQIGRDTVFGCLWGIGLITVPFLLLMATGNLEVTAMAFEPGRLLMLLAFFFVAAAYEEILCRGYLLNNLMQSIHPFVALVVVSLVFSLFHAGNQNVSGAGLINIFLAGVLLGVYYIHRQNLWFPIGLHVAWNFFQGPIYGIPVSGTTPPGLMTTTVSGSELWTGGEFGFEASVLITGLSVVAIIALHFLYRRGNAGSSTP